MDYCQSQDLNRLQINTICLTLCLQLIFIHFLPVVFQVSFNIGKNNNKLNKQCTWRAVSSFVPRNTQLLLQPSHPSSWTCTILPKVMSPTNAVCGIKDSDICRESLRALNSSSSRHVSTTNRKIGGIDWARCRNNTMQFLRYYRRSIPQ